MRLAPALPAVKSLLTWCSPGGIIKVASRDDITREGAPEPGALFLFRRFVFCVS